MQTEACVTSETLNSFLSGGLTPAGREGVEAHLSLCRRCRLRAVNLYADARESDEMHRAPRGLKREALRIPGRGQTAWARWLLTARRYAAPALAAAAVVLVSVGGLAVWQARQDAGRPVGERVREGGATSAAAPRLLSPGGGARVSPDEIEFRWTQAPGARDYTLFLLDERGEVVLKQQTAEERLVLSARASRLAAGGQYFWYVEARFTDGTAAETAVSKFTLGGN
jgi:Putative zinc-finger